MARVQAPRFDVDALLADPDVGIVVCCGSGGVGKTTTAAALGVRPPSRGAARSSSPSTPPVGWRRVSG